MRKLIVLISLLVSLFIVAGCSESNSAREKEQEVQNKSNETLVNNQPAEAMDYSPTRNTAKKWANTWEEKGKIAYVYFSNMQGEQTGYFILDGLPVSYNASLTPTQRIQETFESGVAIMNNPAMDGMYYGAGSDSRYYGYDAVSGAYLEWSANGGQEFFITDQPLSNVPEAKPLGDATIEEVQQQQEQE